MKLSNAILTVILCAVSALAWTGQKAKMNVPFAFAVENQAMPAGTYFVNAPNMSGIGSIESEAGKRVFFLTRPGTYGAYDPKVKAYATFVPTAKGYVLSEVLMPGASEAQKIPGVKPSPKPVQIALLGR